VSSLTKVFDFTSKIAITCLCSSLIACEPLLFGGVAGFSGSSSSGFTCASGPADLSGMCRNTSAPSMGALEAVGTQTASAAAINSFATAQQETGSSVLNISWSPYQGTASGYFVYYGPTSDSTTTLASDIPIGAANFDSAAPAVSYQATLDLGLNTGDSVCFRILAYDTARVPYTWSEIQCTVV
jgi:hypothetical protein